MPKVQMNWNYTCVIRDKVKVLQQSVMPFEVAVQHNGSEGKSPDESVTVPLNISTFSYGSDEFNKKIQ